MIPERRKLGRTGLTVPVMGLGTWGLLGDACGPVSDPQAIRCIERALELGINLFDMAPSWGTEGRAERVLGQHLGVRRDDATLVTRAGRTLTPSGPREDFSGDAIRRSCEASLERLSTDRIDVLLLHNPDADVLEAAEPRATCEALVREGKVRAWGVSTSDVFTARAALRATAQVLCLPHHMLRPELLWSVAEELVSLDVGVLVSSPMCHGLLAGRWSEHKGFAANDHRQRRWTRSALAARIAESQAFRSEWLAGDMVSMASPALRFAVAERCVGSALVGARTAGQLELALRALGDAPYPLPHVAMANLRRKHGFS